MTFGNWKNNRKLIGWPLQVYKAIIKWTASNEPNKWNDMLLTLENNWILTVCLFPDNKN